MTTTHYTQNIPYMPHLLETVIVEGDDDTELMDAEMALREQGFQVHCTITPEKTLLHATRILYR